MEQLFAERLARELKIDVTQVAREYWEVILLNRLFEAEGGEKLVFKGGTALRLAYGFFQLTWISRLSRITLARRSAIRRTDSSSRTRKLT